MNIDFISASLGGGGAERVLVLLANHFVTQGHDVSIITLNDGDDFYLAEQVKRVRLHFGSIKNHTIRSIYNLIIYYKKAKNRPDIVISFLTRTNFMSILACKLFSIKIIVSEHFNHLGPSDKISQFTWNYLYKQANALTVLTKFDKPFFEKKGARVVVMPNPSTFTPIKDNTIPRRKTILAIGCLDRYHDKGFDNLIQLISPVLRQHPGWTLKIVGRGEVGRPIIEKLIDNEGLKQQILFTGFRRDIREVMKESEVFILPSRNEGLPMVLLEAMSQGMACIAFDCVTGPSEMIIHRHNGLLIQDQNMQEMQKGLIQLISDDTLRRKLGKNAVNSLERYSIENICNQWHRLFNEII